MHAATIGDRRRRIALAATAAAAAIGVATALAGAATANAGTAPRCRIHQLSLARPRSSGAAGSIRLRFVFTNSSSSTCSLFGFPGMNMLNKHHQPIHTRVIRGTSVAVPPEPEKRVVMTPGQHGSFYAGYSDIPTGTQRCRTSQTSPPHRTRAIAIPSIASSSFRLRTSPSSSSVVTELGTVSFRL